MVKSPGIIGRTAHFSTEQDEVSEFQSVGCDVTERRKREEHLRDQALAIGQLRTLSGRERDVMKLVVAGDANKVIARKLGLSIKTIEKHRSSLMKKLHSQRAGTRAAGSVS